MRARGCLWGGGALQAWRGVGVLMRWACWLAGRAIKEKLEPAQLEAIKKLTGIPMVDK